jgi:hypothetical protein
MQSIPNQSESPTHHQITLKKETSTPSTDASLSKKSSIVEPNFQKKEQKVSFSDKIYDQSRKFIQTVEPQEYPNFNFSNKSANHQNCQKLTEKNSQNLARKLGQNTGSKTRDYVEIMLKRKNAREYFRMQQKCKKQSDQQSLVKRKPKKGQTAEQQRKKLKGVNGIRGGIRGIGDQYRDKLLKFIGNKEISREKKSKIKMKKVQYEEILVDEGIALKMKGFLKDYEVKETIGRGASSIVKRIQHNQNGTSYALKVYKGLQKWPCAFEEGQILLQLDHPNIIKLVRLIKTKNRVS